jgi:hypothetical protein
MQKISKRDQQRLPNNKFDKNKPLARRRTHPFQASTQSLTKTDGCRLMHGLKRGEFAMKD